MLFYESPDKVVAIRGSVTDANKIVLEWDKPVTPSYPHKTIWFYRVYRNNAMIGESESLQYTDSLVDNNTTYQYKISAVNYYFKESEISVAVPVTARQK